MRYEMLDTVPVGNVRAFDLRPWAVFHDHQLTDEAPDRVFVESRDDLDAYVVAYLHVADVSYPIAIKRYAGEPPDLWTVMLPSRQEPSARDLARLRDVISADIQPLNQL